MSDQIPDGILSTHILSAITDLNNGVTHDFGDSTGYDLLFKGRRYPPKAVIGLAAEKVNGQKLGPYDFKGGLNSRCFRILEANGFNIITKSEHSPFPDEVEQNAVYSEGSVASVLVNKYERDPRARAIAIKQHGARCNICLFDFGKTYGPIGAGFIHVHHLKPLSSIGQEYVLDPANDLLPVCPNCHSMLHKRNPPITPAELVALVFRLR
jgi:5-methylcytosine-specific restriction protein A